MSLLDLLKNPPSTAPAWRGTWARIWLKPSIFSAQTYIVGLAILDGTGLCDYRFITSTDKFGCIYGDTGRSHVDQLLAVARLRLGYAREHHEQITTAMLPPGFVLDPVGYVAGASPLEALEEALNDAEIPMEPEPEEARAPRFRSRPAQEVTKAVMEQVRNRLGSAALSVLREDAVGDERHGARVNLIKPDSAGLIASGWYVSPERVQLELLRAVTTVESYMAAHSKMGQPGVFFLRPTSQSGLRAEQSAAIETALDQIEWQLGRKGVRVSTQDSEAKLADDVAEWAKA